MNKSDVIRFVDTLKRKNVPARIYIWVKGISNRTFSFEYTADPYDPYPSLSLTDNVIHFKIVRQDEEYSQQHEITDWKVAIEDIAVILTTYKEKMQESL